MRITKKRIENVLGLAPKPREMRQKQFDGFEGALQRMAQIDWDKIPQSDLWYFFHDMAYMELQPDLFRHVFPACLKFWHDTLMRNEGAERGDSEFHYALMHGAIMTKMLNEQERQRLFDFFIDGFLYRLQQQQDFAYQRPGDSANAWVLRFNSLGLVAPLIEPIWRQWWTFETKGHAISAIMYASGLVYLKGNNPIYLPWTRKGGGGGPYLTEWDACIFDRAWLAANLEFLEAVLTPDYLLERLEAAAHVLDADPVSDLAHKVAKDAQSRKDIIELRAGYMLADLASLDLQKKYERDW